MSQRDIARVPPDDLWAEWQSDAEWIRRDTVQLFSIRRQFREFETIFRANERLQREGNHLWDYLSVTYAWTILAHLRRDALGEGNGVSLRQLLEEIRRRPDVITRVRWRAVSTSGSESPFTRREREESFTTTWAGKSPDAGQEGDIINQWIVLADIRQLQETTDRLVEVSSRTIAHRSRAVPEELTVLEMDNAFDGVERLLKKYLLLLSGASWLGFEPMIQFNSIAPFLFPWHAPICEVWFAIPNQVKQRAGLRGFMDDPADDEIPPEHGG